MDTIYFEFDGTLYSGHIMRNPAGAEYIWFVFDDDKMSSLFGDTVAFHFHRGKLSPVYHYTNKASFIEDLRKKVEAVLVPRETLRR